MITLCELLSEVCQSIMRTLILAKITTLLVSFYTHLVVKAIFHTSEKRMKIYVPHKICMRYRHTSEKNDIRLLFMCILVLHPPSYVFRCRRHTGWMKTQIYRKHWTHTMYRTHSLICDSTLLVTNFKTLKVTNESLFGFFNGQIVC